MSLIKDYGQDLYNSMNAIWGQPYTKFDEFYEPADMGFEKWSRITAEAVIYLDFKDQFLNFLESINFDTDKIMFMADVLWDLQVME